MTMAELDMAPRTRGRAAKAVTSEFVRDLGPADIVLLQSEREVVAKPVVKLRERHHALARCLAQGMSPTEASIVTGYDVSRISILNGDPGFKDLIASYRNVEDSLFAEFTIRATNLSLSAMNELQERLEDSPEAMSEGTLLEISKFGADRTGHAPVAKTLNINANVELGSRLQAARRRVAETKASAIDAIEGMVVSSGDDSG